MELEGRFIEAMADLDCIGGRKCMIALSGGGDSTALLELCSRTVQGTGNHYMALRVRHDIRESDVEDAETDFCARLCQDMGMEFHSIGAGEGDGPDDIARQTGCGPEQAARDFRHRLIENARIQYNQDSVLFAHTLDDDRETLLMRFFSGSGPEGLKGIPGHRGSIRRPLLKIKGRELRDYLRNHGVSWYEDATNSENNYLRNKIRNRLVPVLEEVFPGWSSAADSLISRSAEVSSALADSLKKELTFRSEKNCIVWDGADWIHASDYLRALALLAGINHLQNENERGTRISWPMIRELRDAANRKQSRDAGGFRLESTPDTVCLRTMIQDWKGRMIFEDIEIMANAMHQMTDDFVKISERPPGFPLPLQSGDFPLEIAWELRETGNELKITTWGQPENSLEVSFRENGFTVTEKSSVADRSDADTEIVYIQLSHNTESEGSNARGQER